MLKVIRNPEFLVPVTVLTPADGGQSEGRFKARFRALTKSEIEAHEMMTGEGTSIFLRDVVLGWEGLRFRPACSNWQWRKRWARSRPGRPRSPMICSPGR